MGFSKRYHFAIILATGGAYSQYALISDSVTSAPSAHTLCMTNIISCHTLSYPVSSCIGLSTMFNKQSVYIIIAQVQVDRLNDNVNFEEMCKNTELERHADSPRLQDSQKQWPGESRCSLLILNLGVINFEIPPLPSQKYISS